jgi:Helicase associated domain.
MWKCRLKELASFKDFHGHCNVPIDYASSYYDLGVWAREQRILYLRLKEGTPSQLNKSRADDLEQIGFSWSINAPKRSI